MSYPPPIFNPRNAVDAEHLRLLAIFHYLAGGLIILISSLFIFHTVIGLVMASHSRSSDRRLFTTPKHTTSPRSFEDTEANPGEPSPEHQQVPAGVSESHDEQTETADFSPLGSNLGYFFAAMGAFMVLSGWTVGALVIASGISLHRRRRRTFSLIVAGLSCPFFLSVPCLASSASSCCCALL